MHSGTGRLGVCVQCLPQALPGFSGRAAEETVTGSASCLTQEVGFLLLVFKN